MLNIYVTWKSKIGEHTLFARASCDDPQQYAGFTANHSLQLWSER